MLVQRRTDGIRCITQHDHGLASGVFADHWSGLDGDRTEFSEGFIRACALHDMLWVDADRQPLWNCSTGCPHDFIDYPGAARLLLYENGLSVLEADEPDLAYWVSLHYSAFTGMRQVQRFQASEAARRARLTARLGLTAEVEAERAELLRYLQFFDLFSLFVCLTPPSALTAELPPWIRPDGVGRTPSGVHFALTWVSDSALVCAPSPFVEPVSVRVPVRDLTCSDYSDDATLREAFGGASVVNWEVTVT